MNGAIAKDSLRPDEPAATDGGLRRIADVLEVCGVDYWVDSGVLLGLARSGRLNAWEKDIDLAVLDDQAERLVGSLDAFARAGFRVIVKRYRGTTFSVGLKPQGDGSAGALRCSIHVYYRVGAHLWSPQVELYQPPPSPDVYAGRRTWAGRLLQRVIERWFEPPEASSPRASRIATRQVFGYRIARAVYRRIDLGWLAETWPVSEVFVPLTWVIPAHLVTPMTTLEVAGRTFPVPHDVPGYLAYRYGDWRTPVTDWCYWEDDGALLRRRPFDVRRELGGVRPP